jgi:hypothetical protein
VSERIAVAFFCVYRIPLPPKILIQSKTDFEAEKNAIENHALELGCRRDASGKHEKRSSIALKMHQFNFRYRSLLLSLVVLLAVCVLLVGVLDGL